jgi:hypothetical protein
MSTSACRSPLRNSRKISRGPIGEKRPADVIGNAVHVMKIATGEIDEGFSKKFENHGHT